MLWHFDFGVLSVDALLPLPMLTEISLPNLLAAVYAAYGLRGIIMLFADVTYQMILSIENLVALSASQCCVLAVMGVDMAL